MRASREDFVQRVLFELLPGDLLRLPVGRAHHNGLDDVTQIPTTVHKLDRQPIQQTPVARTGALDAKVFGGFYNADSKQGRPKAIDGHAGGQWVVAREYPAGEAEAVVGHVWRHGR